MHYVSMTADLGKVERYPSAYQLIALALFYAEREGARLSFLVLTVSLCFNTMG